MVLMKQISLPELCELCLLIQMSLIRTSSPAVPPLATPLQVATCCNINCRSGRLFYQSQPVVSGDSIAGGRSRYKHE